MTADELNCLRIFLAVAEGASFSKAAVALGLSRAAVTESVQRLEARLGARLLNRNSRSVSLTYAGETLRDNAAPSLARLLQIARPGSQADRLAQGVLRLNLSTISASLVVAPVLRTFAERCPLVVIDAQVGGSAKQADAIVRHQWRADKAPRGVLVRHRSRNLVVASPDYLERVDLPISSPEDLTHHRCIRFRVGRTPMVWALSRDGVDRIVNVTGDLIVNDIGLVVAAALAGAGPAYMLESHIADHLATGRLVGLLDAWSPYYAGYYIAPATDRPSPLLAIFLRHLRDSGLVDLPINDVDTGSA